MLGVLSYIVTKYKYIRYFNDLLLKLYGDSSQ